jgi:nifR3 family TIM-barrel protein
MADLTDLPFCLLCKEFGADVVFREMVSSQAIVRKNGKTLKMIEIDERERPVIQQIFGSDPDTMAHAAAMIEERVHPDGIDINMGCPVHKITSNFDGASLMRDPDRAQAIVRAVKAAVSVPVSVKTRLGWNNKIDIRIFVRKLEEAGADLVSIHGRTKEQGYSGKADWQAVGDARKLVPNLPILVNGDIVDAKTAEEALTQSGADGVLIGRGCLGNPWIFQELKSEPLLDKGFISMGWKYPGVDFPAPTFTDRKNIVLKHAHLQIERYGNHGLTKLRKHLPWYFKGDPVWKELRAKLVRVTTMEELEEMLDLV